MVEVVPLEKIKDYVGKEIGVSDWLEITQDRINAFAECTEDRQWIHVNEDMAEKGPYGKTIAHGLNILGLVPYLSASYIIIPAGIKMSLNYGYNRVRFISPLPVGSRIRNRALLKEITDKGQGRILVTIENKVEIEGQERPFMVAECLSMFFV